MSAAQPLISAKQVSTLGETPAEARRRLASEASDPIPAGPQGIGEEVPELTAEHVAAIREAEEGFTAPASAEEEAPQIAEETTAPPSPEKAMDMIQQLSQEKIQFQTELDAAYGVITRYKAKYGELD